MNSVNLIGRLTRDPELRYTKGATPKEVCSFSLAVPRDHIKEGQPNADFINCTAFEGTAAFLAKYMKKGTRIGVSGKFRSDKFKGKDGRMVYQTSVLVDHVYFADGRVPSPEDQKLDPSDDIWTNIPDDDSDGDLPF